MPGHQPTPKEFREAAREMDSTGHPFLADLLREEAAEAESGPHSANDAKES